MHDRTGICAPVDAFQLARVCNLTCVASGRGKARLQGRVVYYDASARPVRQHGLIAHEVAHHVLPMHGEADTEEAVRYTAGALMLPRARFLRDVMAHAWDLERLRERHPNASAEMIARRLTQVREAVITIVDQGRVKDRVCSPWLELERVSKRMTSVERELVDATLAKGETQRANDLLAAYPFFDETHRRVIVVAEAKQLALRF